MGSAPPLLGGIRTRFGLSTSAAGALLSLPILGLGLGAPFGPPVAQRMGYLRGLSASLVVLAAGCAIRAIPSTSALFAGTAIAAGATGIAGVLLPPVVKRLTPTRAGGMTGLYTVLLVLGTATASGLAIPVARAFGGSPSIPLAMWALPALMGAAFLYSRPKIPDGAPRARPIVPVRRWIWRDATAWQVTGFFALETVLFYSLFSWLPSIGESRGVTPGTAALGVSLFSLAGMPMSLLVPAAADRRSNQSGFAAVLSIITMLGLTGLLLAPGHQFVLWTCILGFAQGGAFGLALTLQVIRAPDDSAATHLAGMAQMVAYLVGAGAAVCLGVLHDLAGSWDQAVVAVLFVAVGQLVFGLAAGRDRMVAAPAQPQPEEAV